MNQKAAYIESLFKSYGIYSVGWTTLKRPLSMDLYHDWIDKNYQRDMTYLEKHRKQKEYPTQNTLARSAIVFTIPYAPKHPWPTEDISTETEKFKFHNPVALYAQGKDYHNELPKQLSPLIQKLKDQFPDHSFELFSDSAPILERDLAYRAGLGWIGKNTCLIHPKRGSLFLIGEIYTSLELKNTQPWSPDFCGSCNKCIESCPTGALSDPKSNSFIRRLDPSQCISYLTIEAKSQPPEALRSSLGEWLFGCDICQTVCPWNQKHIKQRVITEQSKAAEKVAELTWILNSSRKALAKSLALTPLSRAAGWKLQRNAIVVATNKEYLELIPLIEKHINDPKLTEIVKWSLKKLNSTKN